MKKKRIVSVLLAAALLFTMNGDVSYAVGTQGESWQYAQERQEDIDGEPDEEPGQPGNPGDGPGQEPGGNPGDGQEKQSFTVEFNLDGGMTAEGLSSFSLQVQEGDYIDSGMIKEVQKKGYFFQGWLDGSGNYYNFEQPVAGNFVLSASWTPISYHVMFDLNGGTGETPAERLLYYGEELVLPSSGVSKKDHVLAGWELEGAGIYQENTAVKNLTDKDGAKVVLKAVWRRGEYKVRFYANGGMGEMEDQVFSCGESQKLAKNKYTRPGYVFVGWNTKDDGKGKSYGQQQEASFDGQKDGGVFALYAVWKANSYKVKYDGNGASSGKVSSSSHVYGTSSKLRTNSFKRKGYKFVGWNTKKNGKGTAYKGGAQVKTLTTKADGTVTLYANWELATYNIKYQAKSGKVPKNAKKTYNMKSSTFSLPFPTKNGYDFDGWYQDAKLKKRVSEVKKGSIGDKTFYAKWVKCTRKPDKKCAKITTCKAVSTGKVKIKATVKKRVASADDRYYLVYVNPLNGKPYQMAKQAFKKKTLSFTLKTAENQGYVTSKFGIAVKKGSNFKLVSNISFVKSPEKAAKNKSKYKLGKTKKGMQFYNNMQEIDNCGAKNNFLNITASYILENPTVPYEYNGKIYYFSNMDAYRQIVSECNKKGINVTMQILLNWVDGHTNLIDPKARTYGAAPFYTWNIGSDSAREKMEAIFCYIGSVFGQKGCYVSNWILGNEINNPRGWNYAGDMPAAYYFRIYAYAFRALYYGVRSQYANARVFICMDNFWNTSMAGGYSAKFSISSFVEHLNAIQGGLKWNLAYHAYSSPLTYTKFWDGYGITYDDNSPYITMKNLYVLTHYIKRYYGSSVRVLLSEVGYASNWGETIQAAALAGSYYIAACNSMVDAFIIRSYHDHPVEVAQGLPMGIAGKEAFDVYKHMDTSSTLKYTNRYLKVIGISSWGQLVPGYNKKCLYNMYVK